MLSRYKVFVNFTINSKVRGSVCCTYVLITIEVMLIIGFIVKILALNIIHNKKLRTGTWD